MQDSTTLEMTMKTWTCVVCGFVYEEALGLPAEGIPAGTKWEDVPDDWCCPECGVAKSDFEMVAL
jgi:rubredoxin